MRIGYCSVFRASCALKAYLFVSIAAAAGSAIALMSLPARAEPASAGNVFCTNLGKKAGIECVKRAKAAIEAEAPPGMNLSLRDKLRWRLNAGEKRQQIEQQTEHICIAEGIATKERCLANPRVITGKLYRRCDRQSCFVIVQTVGDSEKCVKVATGGDVKPGMQLPERGSFGLDECGEEMVEEFNHGERGNGPEILPLIPIVGLACNIGDPEHDQPRWREGYCYGAFESGNLKVCVEARKERVQNGSAERRYLRSFNFEDCPHSVRKSLRSRERAEETRNLFDGRLPPFGSEVSPSVMQGTTANPQSTISGPASGIDPASLFDLVEPQTASPQQLPSSPNNQKRQSTPSQPVDGTSPQGHSSNSNSTISGTTHGAPGSGQTQGRLPTNSPPQQQYRAGGGDPGRLEPGGIKLDAESTGSKANLSDVRNKVLQLAPKRDAVDTR